MSDIDMSNIQGQRKEYYVSVRFTPQGVEVKAPVKTKTQKPWSAMPAQDWAQAAPVPMAPPPQQAHSKEYVYIGELTEAEATQINEFGALAVVESPIGGMTIVTAVLASELDYSSYEGQYKSLVQIIDTGPYEVRQQKIERRRALKKHLERLAAEAREALKVEELLAGNEEAQALLSELRDLSK